MKNKAKTVLSRFVLGAFTIAVPMSSSVALAAVYPGSMCMTSATTGSANIDGRYMRMNWGGEAVQTSSASRLRIECPALTFHPSNTNGVSAAKVFIYESGNGSTKSSCTLQIMSATGLSPVSQTTVSATATGAQTLDFGSVTGSLPAHARYVISCDLSQYTYLWDYRVVEN